MANKNRNRKHVHTSRRTSTQQTTVAPLPENALLDQPLLAHIKAVFDQYLVNADDLAEAIAMSLATGRNLVLFGPGGHAKSEGIELALRSLGLWQQHTHVQSLGTDTSVAELFGGPDIAAMDREKELRYALHRSVFNSAVGVLEEGFDAPASTLSALKDALTSKRVRINGGTEDGVFHSKLKALIVPTNRDPNEVAGMGPTVAALIDRFPLQLNVRWEDYGEDDFERLFTKVEGAPKQMPTADLPLITPGYANLEAIGMNGTRKYLSAVLARAKKDGRDVSPRTAVIANFLVRAHAFIHGRDGVTIEDLRVLRFVPGLENFEAVRIAKDLQRRRHADDVIRAAQKTYDEITSTSCEDPAKCLANANTLAQVREQLGQIQAPESMYGKWERLREQIPHVIEDLRNRATRSATQTEWNPQTVLASS